MISSEEEKRLREILRADPGNPVFVALAQALKGDSQSLEALDVLLAGLSANPDYHDGRLLLAQIFFERGYTPFAIREVQLLRSKLPDLKTIQRLLATLSPQSEAMGSSNAAKETVAEAEFNFDDLDLIDEDSQKS